MMMPANYSAVAENELTYVVGGGLVDTLAPVMEEKNWQTLNTNLIKIVGSSVLNKTVPAAFGEIFGGEYKPGNVLGAAFGYVGDVWGENYNKDVEGKNTFGAALKGAFNVALQGVGLLASIYTLGANDVGYNGAKSFDFGL